MGSPQSRRVVLDHRARDSCAERTRHIVLPTVTNLGALLAVEGQYLDLSVMAGFAHTGVFQAGFLSNAVGLLAAQ